MEWNEYCEKCPNCPLVKIVDDEGYQAEHGSFLCTLTNELARDMPCCPEELDQ